MDVGTFTRRLSVRLGVLLCLRAQIGGAGLPRGLPAAGTVPPHRTRGPSRDGRELERSLGGKARELRRLSDRELVLELEKARRFEAWLSDPVVWLHCWDYRAYVIGGAFLQTLRPGSPPPAGSTPLPGSRPDSTSPRGGGGRPTG